MLGKQRPQISLRTVLRIITVAAILLGWWADRRALKSRHVHMLQVVREVEAAKRERYQVKPPSDTSIFMPTP
jgi:hypothetical protein